MKKKILAVLTAVITVLMFSVNSFALTTVVNADNKSEEKTYQVTIYDQIDEDQSIVYVDSSVKVYKITDKTETLYTTVTVSKGEATVSLPTGDYVMKEDNVKTSSAEYESEDVSFTINGENNLEVYLKHSPVPTTAPVTVTPATVTITEPATEESTTTSNALPYTGSQLAVGAIAALCIACAIATVVILTKKKDKNGENTEENIDTENK